MKDFFIKFIGPEWARQKTFTASRAVSILTIKYMKVRPIYGDSLSDKKPSGLFIHLTILERGYNYNAIIRFSTKFHTSKAYKYTNNETSALKANTSFFRYFYGLQVVNMFSILIYDYVSGLTTVGHSNELSVKKSNCYFTGAEFLHLLMTRNGREP